MSAPQPGEVLAGKYRVERVLGQGGMGVVVQAMHLQLEERVAVKFLLPEYAAQAEAATRFLREARAAVKIKSEHVARVIDVGTLETGAPYMVMEYLAGRDLSEVLETRGPLPCEEVVEYLLQACEALAEAHAAGIVHRDLKPANLFLTQRADASAVVKVLDFGISKVTVTTDSGPDHSLTKTSAMMGSPLYMSPEQMRSARSADARSDIWSLGAILFELTSGKPPFYAESLPELLAQVLTDAAPSLRSVRSDVPAGLSAVVARCLEKDPAARFATVAELAVALATFGPKRSRVSVERISKVMAAAGLSTTGPGDAPETRPPPAVTAGTVANFGKTGSSSGSSRAVTVTATAVGLLILTGVGAFTLNRASHTTAHAEPAAAAPIPAPVAVPPVPSAVPAVPAVPAPVEERVVAPAVQPAVPSSAVPAAVVTAPPVANAPTTAGVARARPSQQKPHSTTVRAAPAPAPTTAPAPAPASKPPSRAAIFGDRK